MWLKELFAPKKNQLVTPKEEAIRDIINIIYRDHNSFAPARHELLVSVVARVLPDYHIGLKPYRRNPRRAYGRGSSINVGYATMLKR